MAKPNSSWKAIQVLTAPTSKPAKTPAGPKPKRGPGPRVGRSSKRGPKETGIQPLSDRELEVLRLFAEGVETDPLATKLGISPKTVRTHCQNILRKLGLHSKLQAVIYAFRQGIARA